MNIKSNGPLVRQRTRAKTATVAFPLDSSLFNLNTNTSSMPDLFNSSANYVNVGSSRSEIAKEQQKQNNNLGYRRCTNKLLSTSMSNIYKSSLHGFPPPPTLNPKLRVLKNTITERRIIKQNEQTSAAAAASLESSREIPIIEKPKFPKTISNPNKPKRTIPTQSLSTKKIMKTINVKIPPTVNGSNTHTSNNNDNLKVENSNSSTKEGESNDNTQQVKKFLFDNLIHRTKEERETNPDSFYCDKRGFKKFPILCSEDSDQLKLLSLQHNFIRRIDNLSYLNNLIVLDLYNNRIERIVGLQVLQSLRVLLLGKNRIRRLDGLENLKRLEILDLHGNQLRYIENCLNSCVCLRILNLAGNIIRSLRNLGNMNALTELNLKRNRIKSLDGLQKCLSLKKLLLANNELSSFSALIPLDKLKIEELLLDSNPISSLPNYTNQIIFRFPWINIFDNSEITNEMKADAKRWYKERQILESEQHRKEIEEKLRSTNSTREEIIGEAKRRWENLKSYVKHQSPSNSEAQKPSSSRLQGKPETTKVDLSLPTYTSCGTPASPLENENFKSRQSQEDNVIPITTVVSENLSVDENDPNIEILRPQKEGIRLKAPVSNDELVQDADAKIEKLDLIPNSIKQVNPLEKLTKIAVVKPLIRKPLEDSHPQHQFSETIVEGKIASSSPSVQTLSSSASDDSASSRALAMVPKLLKSSSFAPKKSPIHHNHQTTARRPSFQRSFSSSTLSRVIPISNISESSSASSSNVNLSGIKPRELSRVESFLVHEKQNSSIGIGTFRKKPKFQPKLHVHEYENENMISSSSSDDSDDDDESTNTSDLSGRRQKNKKVRVGVLSSRRGRMRRGQTALGPKSLLYSYSKTQRPFTGFSKNVNRYESLTTNLEQLSIITPPAVLKKQGSDYLIEVEGKSLNIFGPGSLKHFLTCFSMEITSSINTIKFHFLSFDSIVPYFPKLKKYYPALDHFYFRSNNICILDQLNGLADLQGLSSLYISRDGNPIYENELWEEYATYRLGHWGLKSINAEEHATMEPRKSLPIGNDSGRKSDLFDSLGYLALSCLPQSALTPLAKRLHALHSFVGCSGSSSSGEDSSGRKKACDDESPIGTSGSICSSWENDPVLLDVIGKEALGYFISPQSSKPSDKIEDAIITKILSSGNETVQKLDLLEQQWGSILTEAIQDILVDYRCMDNYAKKELRRLKESLSNGSSNIKRCK